MADCECLPRCPFFNDKMADKPGTASMYKRKFCQGDNSNCARHMIFRTLGGSQVPPNLYPNQVDKAEMLLAQR